jgi:curved DNA-binding protein CbpA
MPRNPFTVLGLPFDASAEAIKVAWRRLARQHHPDVSTGDSNGDPTGERRANRTMAEINAAYQELRDPVKRRVHREAAVRASRAGATWPRSGTPADGAAGPAEAPRPGSRPSGRPVTARIDTSALLWPRNSTLTPLDRSPLPGLPPRPRSVEGHEPPRASTPTGPMHRRRGPSMEADLPSAADAMETRLGFGKFAGRTLGEVAAIEPSYLEWIVRTIDRDPEVSLAARVVLRYVGSGSIRRPRLDTYFPRG